MSMLKPSVQSDDACQFTPPSGPSDVFRFDRALPGRTYSDDEFPWNTCTPAVTEDGTSARPAGLFAAASASRGSAIAAPPIEALAAPCPPGWAPFTAQAAGARA